MFFQIYHHQHYHRPCRHNFYHCRHHIIVTVRRQYYYLLFLFLCILSSLSVTVTVSDDVLLHHGQKSSVGVGGEQEQKQQVQQDEVESATPPEQQSFTKSQSPPPPPPPPPREEYDPLYLYLYDTNTDPVIEYLHPGRKNERQFLPPPPPPSPIDNSNQMNNGTGTGGNAIEGGVNDGINGSSASSSATAGYAVSGFGEGNVTTTTTTMMKGEEEEEQKQTQEQEQQQQWFYDLDLPEDTVCIVEFYAPWCPHCQKFKPHYIELARTILDLSYGDVPIAFYAVSCTANEDLCESYGIDGYPKLLGFPLLSKPSSSSSNGISNSHSDNNNNDNKEGKIEKKKAPTHDEPIILNDTYENVTPEIIGEILGFGVARIPGDELRRYSQSEDQTNYEKEFDRLANESKERKISKLEYKRTLIDIYHDAAQSFVFALSTGVYTKKTGTALDVEKVIVLEEWLDLLYWTLPSEFGLLSLIYELRIELDYIIQSKRNLLNILSRFQIDRLGYIGKDGDGNYGGDGRRGKKGGIIDSNLDLISSSSSSSSLNSPTRTIPIWTEACSYGHRGMGYTCGLWELFHIVTIGASIQYSSSSSSSASSNNKIVIPNNGGETANSNVAEAGAAAASSDTVDMLLAAPSSSGSPRHVANILRSYISNFFLCDVCRYNFLKFYDSCGANSCHRLVSDTRIPSNSLSSQAAEEEASSYYYLELPLWLWETHNIVNVRLMKENAELLEWRNATIDELESALFPTRNMCRKCWNDNNGDGILNVKSVKKRRYYYDKMKVYNYLKRMYWPSYDMEEESIDPSSSSSSSSSVLLKGRRGRKRRLILGGGKNGNYDDHYYHYDDDYYNDERLFLSSLSKTWTFTIPILFIIVGGGISIQSVWRRKLLHKSGRHKKFEDCVL